MNDGPVLLLNWVEENIHPEKFIIISMSNDDISSLKDTFLVQVKAFRNMLFEQLVFSREEAIHSMEQLVAISDDVHHYLYKLAPTWNQNKSANQIRCFYLHTLDVLEQQVEQLKRLAPEIHKRIPVTKYILPQLKMELKGTYKAFLLLFQRTAVDNDLRVIVLRALNQIIDKKNINLMNAGYCYDLMEVISRPSDLDTSLLISLLCQNGFNAPEFYFYCVTNYKLELQNILGLHEQLELVINEIDKLKSLQDSTETNMLPGIAPIRDQLQGYLFEKEQYISQMLKLRRKIIQDEQLAKSRARLRINMSVAQFGLFIRIQMEKGLLLKENVGDLFNFFAAHFYTPQTMFISGESLRKKSTDVEFSTAQKLKAHLIGMLNWLNEHYNLSNYKES